MFQHFREKLTPLWSTVQQLRETISPNSLPLRWSLNTIFSTYIVEEASIIMCPGHTWKLDSFQHIWHIFTARGLLKLKYSDGNAYLMKHRANQYRYNMLEAKYLLSLIILCDIKYSNTFNNLIKKIPKNKTWLTINKSFHLCFSWKHDNIRTKYSSVQEFDWRWQHTAGDL